MYPYYLRLASKLPALANRLQATTLFKKMAGVSPQRQLPAFTLVPFTKGVEKAVNAESSGQNVILLVDIFTQYQSPQVAEDAVTVLKAASLTVHPVLMKTSPRQLISQGLLAEAKTASQQLLGQINAHPREFLIVGLEPSELLVLRDELVSLVGAEYKEQASEIKSRAFLLE
jgi:Fe-S oxidoreductase